MMIGSTAKMMLSTTPTLLRGKYMDVNPHQRTTCQITATLIGGHPKVKAAYNHFNNQAPMRPLRAIGLSTSLPPVLYERADQLMLIDNALAHKRLDNQVSVTLSQMSLGMRNAEEFLEVHVLAKEMRPSLHQLWFHEEHGLRQHQHVLSGLTTQHIVPLVSLLSYDYEKGRMELYQAEECFVELIDASVGNSTIVHREICNQMIRCYALAGEFGKAVDLIDEMKRRNIRRNFITYAPIFRMIRKAEDAEGHIAFNAFVVQTEGGILNKFMFIDVPRMVHPGWVMIRWNWIAISVVASALLMAFTAMVLHTYKIL